MKLLNDKGIESLAESIQRFNKDRTEQQQNYIGVVQFNDRKYGIFESNYPARCVAWINSEDYCDHYPEKSVHHIVGIKEVSEDRTLEGVVNHFTEKAGAENVYSQSLVFA